MDNETRQALTTLREDLIRELARIEVEILTLEYAVLDSERPTTEKLKALRILAEENLQRFRDHFQSKLTAFQ